MSCSPRFQPPFQAEPWEDTSHSLSPIKWMSALQPNKKTSKLLNYEKSSNLFTKQQRVSAKTQPKFYQKTHKRIQNGMFKQKMDSIKPLTCHQYEESHFIIGPKSKRLQENNVFPQNMQNQKSNMHTPCIGLINPMYINVKCNPNRMGNSCQLPKQKLSQHQLNNRNFNRTNKKINANNCESEVYQTTLSPVKKLINPTENLYYRIVSEMNEYFNAMNLVSFVKSDLFQKNNKTQYLSKRSIRPYSQKKDFQQNKKQNRLISTKNSYKDQIQDENLNIVGLRPKINDYQRINRNYTSNVNFPKAKSKQLKQKESLINSKVYESQQLTLTKDQNQQIFTNDKNNGLRYDLIESENISSMIISNQIISNQPHRIKQKRTTSSYRPLTQQIKRNFSPVMKKIKYKGFCFGEINNPKNSADQIYRLKVLYYKDLLWKNSFNLGLRYTATKNVQQSVNLKYFVGKGNNSKLIKNLMSKRWWWSLQSKEENSNFVWTQLKIYSIYQKQTNNIKLPQNSQINFYNLKEISLLKENNKKLLQQKNIIDNSALVLKPQMKRVWQNYISYQQNRDRQKKITEQNLTIMRKRLEKNGNQIKSLECPLKISNHIQFSRAIGNKKALYKVMMLYFLKVKKCPPEQIFVPLTYHITAGLQDEQYLKFLAQYYRRNKTLNKTCWIVKPGQLTNRGRGIKYCKDLNQIKPIVKKKETHPNGCLKTFLIQQYLDRPLLYKGRKFDIRHYIMISSINGKLRGYFYQGGYIRTTSYKYKLDDNSPAIHLTNDAVQKYCKDYGKYEKGNKLSYQQFDEYMQEKYPSQNPQNKTTFFNTIHPQIKRISTDVIHAAYYFIDPNRKINNFEIFGLDIMIDESLKCYLIEVNTNPCLQLSSPVLKNVIPDMLDNAFALTLDCCYPPPQKQFLYQYNKKYKYPTSPDNKFELVFDEDTDGLQINQVYKLEGIEPSEMSGIGDDDENFQSCEEDNQDH